ncbi:TPA: hypothetical protein ACJI4S_002224 [Staphylococcus pseudintermedius]|uniref:hypothetical protein n=1 Tax=Staphylococcus coagulans TaxID=74706 RepID=UPI001A07AFD9|nr:hypothetical protein [Staphylococcus pseudintermedius]EHT1768952.1 hypothetical protein [Staphylococcus pseudintermedius]
MAQINFKRKKLQSGNFRTPVKFFVYVNEGPYPDESEEKEVFSCFAETYAPSIKDLEVLDVAGNETGLTIVIRDPLQSYTPRANHVVKVNDYRLEQDTYNIKTIRLDAPESGFITLVLGAQ